MFALSVLPLSIYSARAQGIVVAQHSGSTDPTTEGFSLVASGQHARVGPVLGDMGMNAWATTVSNVNNNIGYQYFLTPDQQAQLAGADWTLSSRLRVVASSGVLGNNYASFSMGTNRFNMFIGSEPNGDPFVLVGDSSLSPTYILQGGGQGYHDYQLRYSAAAGAADLWIDGVPRLTGLLGSGAGFPALRWGESQAGPSQANWNFVSLQIVPEPAPLALFVIGLSPLLSRRLRLLRPR
jgi:hypothetical protein